MRQQPPHSARPSGHLARASSRFQSSVQALELPSLPAFELPNFLARIQSTPQSSSTAVPAPPDVLFGSYDCRGSWKRIGGFETYIVGPESCRAATVGITDILGLTMPILQGADILHQLSGMTVYLPDLFGGNPYPSEAFPPQSRDEILGLQRFFIKQAHIDDRRDELKEFGRSLRGGGIQFLAAYGVSWGGKLATLVGESTTPFDAVAALSPAFMSPPDVEALKIPIALLLSADEPPEVAALMLETIRNKTFSSLCVLETYDRMGHGFAGSVARLEDEETRRAFLQIYTSLAAFLRKASHASSR